MIDCGHMWLLWSGYFTTLNAVILWLLGTVFFLLTGHTTNDVLFAFLIWVYFNCHCLLLITVWTWLSAAAILFGEGQSRVCTWVFRWWFTYILSSWVIEWLSHFSFMMTKVGIYCRTLLSHHLHDWISLWAVIISWSPIALAFNTQQLFCNYLKCTHRLFRGHTCAMTCQLRPFPKDLFELQSTYIPVHWVYLEKIILTTKMAVLWCK